MFSWWLIRLIACLALSCIYGQDHVAELADIEPIHEPPVEVDLSVNDDFRHPANHTLGKEGMLTKMMTSTLQAPEPFACHECANCKSESDYILRPCHPGITMCYKMEKRIDNTTQIIRRGCSVSANQCIVPDDDRIDSIESITCCTTHKCNQAIQFRQTAYFLFFAWSLWTIFISPPICI